MEGESGERATRPQPHKTKAVTFKAKANATTLEAKVKAKVKTFKAKASSHWPQSKTEA